MEHDRVVMCSLLIEELDTRGFQVSNLPENLCTHFLFRIDVKNALIPATITDGSY
jgi:hypothetical protein